MECHTFLEETCRDVIRNKTGYAIHDINFIFFSNIFTKTAKNQRIASALDLYYTADYTGAFSSARASSAAMWLGLEDIARYSWTAKDESAARMYFSKYRKQNST